MSRLRLHQESTAADQAWMAEVAVTFGERDAGLARFDGRGRGERGTRMRELYDLYVKAREAYQSQ